MVQRRSQIGLAVMLAAIAIAACGGTQSQSQSSTAHGSAGTATVARSGYPATFVAVSQATKTPGITVYSSVTGQPVRRLTNSARDIDPMLTANHKWVYYVQVPANLCPVQLWRIPLTGGTATKLSTAGYPGGPVAVSPDGRMLAYISTPPGPCKLDQSPTWLVLDDLATGETHRIAGDVWGVAWSPDDKTLAVVSPSASGPGALRLVKDPFSATSFTAGAAVPCPTENECAENTPSFDSQGNLFYTAVISPTTNGSCWQKPCAPWRYEVVAVHGSSATGLTSHVVNAEAVLNSSAISNAGDAALYTLPQTNGDLRVWRWTASGVAPIPGPGSTSATPVWR
jgi:WD40 repeat protein